MIHYFPDSRYRWGSDFLELHKNLEAEGNYRQHPDYDVWLANLKKRKDGLSFHLFPASDQRNRFSGRGGMGHE